jgi:hypothetical protein
LNRPQVTIVYTVRRGKEIVEFKSYQIEYNLKRYFELRPLLFTHVDICAANAAGMIGIGVLSGLDDRQKLLGENPHMILSGVEELIDLF